MTIGTIIKLFLPFILACIVMPGIAVVLVMAGISEFVFYFIILPLSFIAGMVSVAIGIEWSGF